jgi:hypothetical protein
MKPQRRSIRLAMLRGVRRLTALASAGLTQLDLNLQLKVNMAGLYRQRRDDIFVVSFPKSGTTLTQMMLYQLKTDGEMDFPHIDSVSPFFEFRLSRGGGGQFFENLSSPRVFKSHLRYEHMPRGVKSIYLARDPRDVAVSAYHHLRLVTGHDLEFAPFIGMFLRDRTMFRSWFKHIESWWPHRNDPNVLFLRYEEVILDLPGAVRQVATFCGLPLDEEKLARVVERCSVSFMKQHSAKFDLRLAQLSNTSREFIRKGTAGEGREMLTPAQQAWIARRLAATARKLGCSPDELLLPKVPPQA